MTTMRVAGVLIRFWDWLDTNFRFLPPAPRLPANANTSLESDILAQLAGAGWVRGMAIYDMIAVARWMAGRRHRSFLTDFWIAIAKLERAGKIEARKAVVDAETAARRRYTSTREFRAVS